MVDDFYTKELKMTKDFGKITSELMYTLRLTQSDLGEILGVRQSSVARYSDTKGPSGDQGIKLMILSSTLESANEYKLAQEILSHPYGKLIMRTILSAGCADAEPLYWAWLHEDEAQKLSENFKRLQHTADSETKKTAIATGLPVIGSVLGGLTVGALLAGPLLAPAVLFGGSKALATFAGGVATGKIAKELFSDKAEYERAYSVERAKLMNSGTLSGILKSPAIHSLHEYLTKALNTVENN